MTTTISEPQRRTGRPKGRQTWTRERVLEALVAYYKATGRWPDGTDLCPAKARASGRPHSVEAFDAGDYPSEGAVRRLFGSVRDAVSVARPAVDRQLAQREREIRARARKEQQAAERARKQLEQAARAQAREEAKAAKARPPAPATFAELYRQATIAAGGVCPIEAGVILRLVDNECRHERLPFDATPPCGCFPEEGAVVVELPARPTADASRRAA